MKISLCVICAKAIIYLSLYNLHDCTFKFEDYKNCLGNNEKVLRSQQSFRIERHNIFTEKVIKIALSANDDKRLQMLNGII